MIVSSERISGLCWWFGWGGQVKGSKTWFVRPCPTASDWGATRPCVRSIPAPHYPHSTPPIWFAQTARTGGRAARRAGGAGGAPAAAAGGCGCVFTSVCAVFDNATENELCTNNVAWSATDSQMQPGVLRLDHASTHSRQLTAAAAAGELLVLNTRAWFHATELEAQEGPSLSYASPL